VVGLIDHAAIDVDLTDRMESVSENFRYTLCDKDGNPVDVALVTTDVPEVHLDVRIQRFKQIPLRMQLHYGGGAWESSVDVSIDPVNISVSGSEMILQDLNEIVLGSIDLATLEEDLEATYTINLPEGITNLSERTEATVQIRFRNLSIVELETRDITVINVPEGLEAVLMNQALKVRLRGPAGLMKNITSDAVKVIVDFSGKEIGSFTIKPTITVQGEAFKNVGAVGTYSVSATLRQTVVEEVEETEG
jgi:YbbR domain-containing protein